MALNIEAEVSIKYADESGTYHFFIGDEVECHTEGKKYIGRITFIGRYNEIENEETQTVIYLDTADSDAGHSGEMVKLNEITSMHKNPFMDEVKPFGENKEFKEYLVDKGFSKEKAEAVSEIVNAAIILNTTPVLKAVSYAVKVVDGMKNGEMSDEELKDAVMNNAKECAAVAVKEYLDLLDMFIRKIGREGKHGMRFTDVLNIVSECWDDLVEQEVDRIAEMAEKMRR